MISYRKAWKNDAKIIENLAIELCEWESKAFDEKYIWNHPWTKEGKKIIENAINSDDFLVIIAENENVAIWFILCSLSKPAFYFNFEKLAGLNKIFIKEEYRWKKIGEELMNMFMDWAKQKDADRMEIYSFYENEIANNFYEKFWFEKKALYLRKDLN